MNPNKSFFLYSFQVICHDHQVSKLTVTYISEDFSEHCRRYFQNKQSNCEEITDLKTVKIRMCQILFAASDTHTHKKSPDEVSEDSRL